MKHHVSGEFSDRDHVGGFLQLDRLLVDKLAPVVEDDVWVEGAVLGLAFRGGAGSVRGHPVHVATHASHRRGSAAFSPPRVLGTLTVLTVRQPLHCRWSCVARDDSCEALMTMPGSRTSVVRVFA